MHLVLDARRLLATHLNRITAWNVETGNMVFELNAGAGTLMGAFSADQRRSACSRWIAPTMSVMKGGRLVTYRAREPEEAGAIVFVFDLETGERRFRWRIGEDANDRAAALALDSDGANLAIATASGALNVIEVATGRHVLKDPGEPVERVQFSPTERSYVVREGTATTYEVPGGGDHSPPEQPGGRSEHRTARSRSDRRRPEITSCISMAWRKIQHRTRRYRSGPPAMGRNCESSVWRLTCRGRSRPRSQSYAITPGSNLGTNSLKLAQISARRRAGCEPKPSP